jgi:glycosyltransferase involved in cell wall biosynthesis
LKVVHVDSEKTWRGGEAQILHLCRGLRSKGHEMVVVAPPQSALGGRAAAEGFTTKEIPMKGELDPAAVWRLAGLLRREQPQVLHLHTSHAVALGSLAALIHRPPLVVAHRRVDFSTRNNPFRRWKYQGVVDCIVAISRGIKEVLVADGLSAEKITVIHSAIDVGAFDPALSPNGLLRELKLEGAAPLLGIVAHLADHKGHKYLIAAVPYILEAFPAARLLIAGDGELRQSLEEQVRALGVEPAVLFLGYRQDVPRILAALDLFVLSSHLEGLCTSLMDAMAMKKAVVATRVGGVPEVVAEGVNGVLVPAKDPRALAQGIISLLKDPDRVKAMGEAGRRIAEEKFHVDIMVNKIEKLYQELLQKKTSKV